MDYSERSGRDARAEVPLGELSDTPGAASVLEFELFKRGMSECIQSRISTLSRNGGKTSLFFKLTLFVFAVLNAKKRAGARESQSTKFG